MHLLLLHPPYHQFPLHRFSKRTFSISRGWCKSNLASLRIVVAYAAFLGRAWFQIVGDMSAEYLDQRRNFHPSKKNVLRFSLECNPSQAIWRVADSAVRYMSLLRPAVSPPL